MSTKQPMQDGLAANQFHFDLTPCGEPVINSTSEMPGPPHEIKLDERHRILGAFASSNGHIFYVALTIGLLATFGLAWMVLNGAALPFDLAPVGGSAGNRYLDPKIVSSSVERSSTAPSTTMTDTQKADRPQTHDTTGRDIGRGAPAEASHNQNLSPVSTMPLGAAPLSPPASKQSAATQRHTDLTGVKAEELRTPTKLTPTSETRPTTIKGWTLRAVTDGTAVLEGPSGVWKARPGQTVPGVGRVDSIVRWGNRLIVATSRGLISTP